MHSSEALKTLIQFKDQCIAEDVLARPSFETICQALSTSISTQYPAAENTRGVAPSKQQQTLEALQHGDLKDIRELDLQGLGLTCVPPEVFRHAATLEKLNLSKNPLSSLPDEFACLKKLRILFFLGLPQVLGDIGYVCGSRPRSSQAKPSRLAPCPPPPPFQHTGQAAAYVRRPPMTWAL